MIQNSISQLLCKHFNLIISENISPIHLFGTGSRGQRLLNSQNLCSSFLSPWFLWGTWIAVHVNQMHRPSPPPLVSCGPFPYCVPCFFWWDLFSVPYIELNVSPRFQSDFVTWFKCTRGYFDWIASFLCASRDFVDTYPCHIPEHLMFFIRFRIEIIRCYRYAGQIFKSCTFSDKWDMANYISSSTRTELVKIRY